MIERHFKKIRAHHPLSAVEEDAIRGAISELRTLPAGLTAVQAGVPINFSMILTEGLMCRYKDLPDGRRQITELSVAGDPTDVHAFTLKHLDHSIATLSPCEVAILPHDRAERLFADYPRLARLYWFGTNLDASIQREWTVSLGRRNANERMAALFCEMRLRLQAVGLGDETGYHFPLTQEELAECVGLTPVHVNRMLRELRERGLMEFRNRRVTILDIKGLERLADFDPAYLYLDRTEPI